MDAQGPPWILQAAEPFPADWGHRLQRRYALGRGEQASDLGPVALQLLWQRGHRDSEAVLGFLDPRHYGPTPPQGFGPDMDQAVARLQQAREHQERVAIWGDFDADGVTATALLWDGLGQFFVPERQLRYYIPHRFTESHGISVQGLEALAAWGCQVLVTADTGSTSLEALDQAARLGMDVIVTDHHTLPVERPPVVAMLNPRSLPPGHPLGTLSGVGVAYKLLEALYQTVPDGSQAPLEQLLDLVAVGLIADLVELTGDCRYLTQVGLQQLQRHLPAGDRARRPGLAALLKLCKRTGDRPSDVAFGIGPRINAVSRIHGDARFCVDLLTSRDPDRCRTLALEAELANSRRQALQRELRQQVGARIATLDLATTAVIVLADEQWPAGVLGLVAGQVAQDYGRPVILLCLDPVVPGQPEADRLARGSARSLPGLDLYHLFQSQAALLKSYGGHPLAAGLTLPTAHIGSLRTALNRQVRAISGQPETVGTPLHVDLEVTVAALGQGLFRQLKLLEPYGMGNPVPRLLIRNAWFERAQHRKIRDRRGSKLAYMRTEFDLWDDTVSVGFPGTWWDHYRDDLPAGRCDCLVELDFDTRQRYQPQDREERYQVRLIGVRPAQGDGAVSAVAGPQLLDWREAPSGGAAAAPRPPGQPVVAYPQPWQDWQAQCQQAIAAHQPLAIAYPAPSKRPAPDLWRELVGIAKYLSRTQQPADSSAIAQRLGLSPSVLEIGWRALTACGLVVRSGDDGAIRMIPGEEDRAAVPGAIAHFLAAVEEDQFRQRYFHQVPLDTLAAMAQVPQSRPA